MKIDFATPFVAAAALWRRDRALLIPLAGLFLFVPTYARLLLVPDMPMQAAGDASQEAMIAWTRAAAAWATRYGAWYLIPPLLALFATLAASALYVARERPTLGVAMARGLRLLPRYVLAMVLLSLPIGAVLMIALAAPVLLYVIMLPVMWLFARTMLVAPVLIAEGPVGAVGAIVRSWHLTKGNGAALTLIYAAASLIGPLIGSLFLRLEALGGPNPVLVAITSAAAALATVAGALALVLAQVALYARLVSKGT